MSIDLSQHVAPLSEDPGIITARMLGEGVHWYARDGKGVRLVEAAKGGERAPSLRDARKFGWFPSVTSVLKVMAKPGLEKWMHLQLISACLTLPEVGRYWSHGIPAEQSEKEFIAEIVEDAMAYAHAARDQGSEAHGAIRASFLEQPFPERWVETVLAVRAFMVGLSPAETWTLETPYADDEKGDAGTIDGHCPTVILDFKSKSIPKAPADEKELKALVRSLTWPEDQMQLAAYDMLLARHEGTRTEHGTGRIKMNVYISREVPGLYVPVVHPAPEIANARLKYLHLLDYWKLDREYWPETWNESA